MFYVYIIQSQKDDSLYIDHTNNLDKRLSQHNNPDRKSYTAKREPLEFKHKDKFSTRREAMQRERFLKSHAGVREKKALAGFIE